MINIRKTDCFTFQASLPVSFSTIFKPQKSNIFWGFLLADSGFDVWLGNIRGNSYSIEHVNYTRHDPRYWAFRYDFIVFLEKSINIYRIFRWDEMSKYDLESMIERILNVTRQRYLYYVGHSQGTEIMFAKLASDPTFGKKVNFIVNFFSSSIFGHF